MECVPSKPAARRSASRPEVEVGRDEVVDERGGGRARYAGAVDDDAFWALIALLDWKKTGDDEAVVRPLVRALAKRSVEEIQRFDDLLADRLHHLDGEAFARHTGAAAYRAGEHFSVDAFLYARCCVVANGRAFYDAVVADPTRMPKDLEFEALLEVAADAYERRTRGKEYTHVPTPSPETFANREGWPWRAIEPPRVAAHEEPSPV